MTGPTKAFTRARRLTASREFTRVFRGADRSSDSYFTVLAKLNDGPEPRLGLAISRSVAPRAVDRNRLKRLARESFRQLHLRPLDFVVTAKRDAVKAAKVQLRSSLDRHFDRLNRRAGDS